MPVDSARRTLLGTGDLNLQLTACYVRSRFRTKFVCAVFFLASHNNIVSLISHFICSQQEEKMFSC
jgi:hypothetical protein